MRALTRTLLRSFSVQGSWNFETMLGYGFGYALLPVLRDVHGADGPAVRQAAERHSRLFNSHPYLSPLALAAVARLEVERQPPQLIERFKTALRGALGGLGDRVVWAGWRPACILLSLVVLLAGAPWWLGVGGFLLIYNAGHLALRWWGFRVGWREGMSVAARLRGSWLWDAEGPLHQAGPFLLGAVAALLVGHGLPAPWSSAWTPLFGAVAVVALLLGLGFGPRIRHWAEAALLLSLVVGFGAGVVGA